MDKRLIYEIPQNEKFDLYILIKNANVRTDRNGRDFIAFTFQDKSGTIDGMYWSAMEDEVEAFQSGRVVRLKGHRELYNGQPQVKISGLRLAHDGEPNDPSLFIADGPMKVEDMKAEIEAGIKSIMHPVLKKIVGSIMTEYDDIFYQYPAAKRHHHAFVGGLAFHTVSMLRLAQAIAKLYPNVDKSLLYAGVILHDTAKVIEFVDPLSGDYSIEGNLIGHISLMGQKISLTAEQLGYRQDEEAVVLLKHMILAHHGKNEFGSPVTPRLLEAEILHRVDDLDAKINMMTSHLKDVEPGEFTPKIMGLEGRSFYHPSDDYYQNI
ncbi:MULTISPECIES: 3'-5' exoribonuclease YhaM family protein [Aerococcus]|uniref:3'-5' exoribonuclease YhaM family protein n=1 Tax=Aerococcus urinae (strain CCUG 59500 / ACS-120-V-Col10a) TaxID=2976812 RepID=UPI000200FA0B|nr:HD domain-containing protein [Aerococcus sp. Group 1]AEA00602.1 HD domain protein [Aerococcus sp. Group 1]MCY3054141.1 HD domain-containing protein [Aerococcus sp. Group 1]MCY3055871.1 HD domain-containing protein [Aerococcus sp. Group 1]MCY3061594.1 HD domain-containing protein [Aerococcus sp. Group 1]